MPYQIPYHADGPIQSFKASVETPILLSFREAIRIQPDYVDAHNNLGNLLSGSGDFQQARYHFEMALRLRPEDAATRYHFAMALGRARHFDEAQTAVGGVLADRSELADAHQLLADLLMAKGQAQAALRHYREAVRIQPDSGLEARAARYPSDGFGQPRARAFGRLQHNFIGNLSARLPAARRSGGPVPFLLDRGH